MNRKALSSIAALALLGTAAAAARAQVAPAPPAPPVAAPVAAPLAPVAPPAQAGHGLDLLPAIAAVPDAPEAPEAPDLLDVPDAPDMPDAPEAPPAPPQEPAPAPAPPAVATTFFLSGNFLGVRTEEVMRENMQRYGLSGEPRGVGVREVVKGSPAEKAGLRANDVIVRFDGEPVTSVRKLTRLIEESAPERIARIGVLRGGSEQELSATLARREPFVSAGGDGFFSISPDILGHSERWHREGEKWREKWEEMARKHPRLFAGSTRRIGVATNALGKQLAEYFGVAHGLLVSSVEAGSPAEKAGIRAGDILTEADGQKVEDSDDLVRALSAKDEGEVTLTVVRDRNRRTVRVTPERRQVPQGMFAPGTFRLFESPVAAVTLQRMQMRPDVLTVTPNVVAPRILTAPRIRATPRARVIGRGDRIL